MVNPEGQLSEITVPAKIASRVAAVGLHNPAGEAPKVIVGEIISVTVYV